MRSATVRRSFILGALCLLAAASAFLVVQRQQDARPGEVLGRFYGDTCSRHLASSERLYDGIARAWYSDWSSCVPKDEGRRYVTIYWREHRRSAGGGQSRCTTHYRQKSTGQSAPGSTMSKPYCG